MLQSNRKFDSVLFPPSTTVLPKMGELSLCGQSVECVFITIHRKAGELSMTQQNSTNSDKIQTV